jgi:hypothetical protein
MRIQLRHLHSDEGAVAVLVAILAVVLVGMAAFTTDFGMAYAQRQAMATGADSAALAIVRENYQALVLRPNLSCGQLKSSDNAKAPNDATKASNVALTQINANAPFGASLDPSQVTTSLECVGSNEGTLKATVSVRKSVNTIFGGIFGVSTIDVSRDAAAALGAASSIVGWRPIGVCADQAQQIVKNAAIDRAAGSSTYRHELVTIDRTWKDGNPCGEASGNWGWLDCGGNGEPNLADKLRNGCPQPLTLDTSTTPASYTITGTPGNKGNGTPVQNAMSAIMDTVVALPVYSTVSSSGNNATFTVVGFLSVRMCGYEGNGRNQEATPGNCYVTTDPLVSNILNNVVIQPNSMQVQYVNYTPVGEYSPTCAIGDLSCAFNVYLTNLIH